MKSQIHELAYSLPFWKHVFVVIHVTEPRKLGQKKLFSSLYPEWATFPGRVFGAGMEKSGEAGQEWGRGRLGTGLCVHPNLRIF